MRKISIRLITSILLITILTGCGKSAKSQEPVTYNVVVPDGIPALTMAKIIKEDSINLDNIDLEYSIEKATDALAAKVLSKEADIAIVPSNLAAQTYNKGLDYRIVATGSWGSFYLISEDNIEDLSALEGESITTIGKNLTPDIMLRHILELKGLKADQDVSIEYLNGATELAPNYISGQAKIVSVPEPMLTTIMGKKADTNIILDLNEEWKIAHSSDHGYPQSSLIIKEDIIRDNEDFIKTLLDEYEESIKWANENPDKLGEYAQELDLALNPEVLAKALDRANIKYVPINDSIEDYNKFFEVLFNMEAKVIGGEIPDEGLYFK